MPLTDPATRRMWAAFAADARWLSVHSADPGDVGLWETGAARQPIAWSAPQGGQLMSSSAVEFAMPKGSEARFVGYWTERFSGVFLGGRELSEGAVFSGAGSYRIAAGMLVEALEAVGG